MFKKSADNTTNDSVQSLHNSNNKEENLKNSVTTDHDIKSLEQQITTQNEKSLIEESQTEESKEESKEECSKTSNEKVKWDSKWKYAEYSAIHSDSVMLYHSSIENKKNFVVAINAGHGTSGGSSVKTQCHPDGSPKVTGGSTAKGATYATAVSSGTTLMNGTAESVANLSLAIQLKELLLEKGFDVLMIRESDDVQLDNIARTVFANNNADCHLALHYDSSTNDKGFFIIGVPDEPSYKAMEPVASHWKDHQALGESILEGMKANNIKIYSNGFQNIDLTQTSFSTIPSIDIEVGDRKSDHSESTQRKLANGILDGLELYIKQK